MIHGPILVPLLVFGAVFLVLMAAYSARTQARAVMSELRRRLGAPERDTSALLRTDRKGTPKLARWLAESGLGWKPAAFRNWTLISAATGLLLGAFAGGIGTAFFFSLIGSLVLPGYVTVVRGRRLARLNQQMPQALQIMILALRAGHALPGALALASREAPLPVREELRTAAEQHALGRPIGEVIGGLAQRIPGCDTAQTFAVAVLVLEQTGGNLIQVIERIIDTARARNQYLAKRRALTAQGRWSAIILAALPPAFALIAATLDPSYGRTLFHTGSSGLGVILLAAVLWVCGVTWTWRMVKKNT